MNRKIDELIAEKVFGWTVLEGDAIDESGAKHRPASEDWYRSVRDQTREMKISFFLKQFIRDGKKIHTPELDGQKWMEYPA